MITFFKLINKSCEFFFLYELLNQRISEKRRNSIVQTVILMSISVGGLYLYENLGGPWLGQIWYLLIGGIIYIFFKVKDQYTLCSFMLISYCTEIMAQRYVISNLFHIILDPLGIFTEYQMTLIIFTALSICIWGLYEILRRIDKHAVSLIPNFYWGIFMAMQCMLFGVLHVGGRMIVRGYSVQYLAITSSLYIFVLALTVLFARISRDFRNKLKQSLYEQQTSLQSSYQQDVEKMYDEMRKLKHELKNHFFYIETLMEEGEYRAAEEYLEKVSQVPKELAGQIDVGNTAVNAILNSKAYQAKARKISFEVSGAVPHKINIEPSDIFGLLSNLLENALENVNPENARISVKVEMVKSYLSITVFNTVKEPVLEKNPYLETIKSDKKIHGYGMQIIRAIVEKYNGILEYQDDKDGFVISVMLQNQ